VEIIGPARTRHLLFTGRLIDARRAHAIGMVHEVVPAADVEQAAAELARMLADNAPLSLAGIKAVIQRTQAARDAIAHDDLDALALAARRSADASEGRRAMLEKRTPQFRGDEVMAKRRVVITGAAGYVAQRMFKALDERWDVVPIDIRAKTREGTSVPRLVVADLTQPDRNAYRQHFKGADAVIHCGFVRAPGMTADTWQDNSDAKFQAEHANVALAYNVYRVALEEGVRR